MDAKTQAQANLLARMVDAEGNAVHDLTIPCPHCPHGNCGERIPNIDLGALIAACLVQEWSFLWNATTQKWIR